MSLFKPDELFPIAVQSGYGKLRQTLKEAVVMGALAGAYIALGSFLAMRVGCGLGFAEWGGLSKFIFAVMFPIGLFLVIVCGADLFTGNCMTLVASRMSGIKGGIHYVKAGVMSYFGNFVGALFVAYCMAYMTGLIFDKMVIEGKEVMPWASSAVSLALYKCHLTFGEAFWRGVGCNWMVCLAVYAAFAAKDVMGKIAALWIPTAAFVALGFEHCIANMFFIPLAIFVLGDERYISWMEKSQGTVASLGWNDFFVNNLIPVTLGNIVGGSFLVACLYGCVHILKKNKAESSC